MSSKTIDGIIDTWINGNITDAKDAVRKMSKATFLKFMQVAIRRGISPMEIGSLVEDRRTK